MRIMSIQSSVAYGHVGNSAATFPLMRIGHEVWPVLTVHFSNHTGYGQWRGPLLAPQDITEVILGISERGVLPTCDAVLSGYQGAQAVGDVVLGALDMVREANPDAVYCCDPVMGDVGRGFFVQPGIPEYLRDRVIPRADLTTPNLFELEFLTGRTVTSHAEALDAAQALRAMGPEVVLVTSLKTPDTPSGTIQMLAVDSDGAHLVTTPELPISVNGAGDATAALFLAHQRTVGTRQALERTAGSIYGLLAVTSEGGFRELQLVAAQDEFVAPTNRFRATTL